MTKTSPLLWTTLLGLVAVVGSYGLACVFPFAAVAALAAVTLDARRGLFVVGATFVANQAIGFTLLSFPHDAQAYAWGGFIAAGALAAFGAARAMRGETFISARTVAALAAAIFAYQGVMFIGAVALDGFASSTPAIVAQVVLADLLWFAGLGALYLALGQRRAEPAAAQLVRQP